MINYIGNFNEIEKEYIEKSLKEDNSILLKIDPYFPSTSIENLIKYINLKRTDSTSKVFYFNRKLNQPIRPVVTPGIFLSKFLEENPADKLLLPSDCIVYIQQGCSENCICTSAYKCRFSVPYEDIKEQILKLPQRDYITLYGINIGDYDYNNTNIIELCKRILLEFPQSKLILCNISPYSPILSDLVNYIQSESRIVPIFYMCINSGSPKILNIEGHKNTDNDLNRLLENTNIKIIAYLIVGSPEENIEDFEYTIQWVKKHSSILFGAIVLPYTINGIGNCNQTISADELIQRLTDLSKVVLEYSIDFNNTSIPSSLVKNILQVSISGEDHKFYKRYGFDCL